mgnify:CR=1 FL=1
MNIETFIIEIYCCIEEKLRGIKLRSRGFAPKLTDAELITMEIVGHLTHQNCTEWIYNYFKTHWQDLKDHMRKAGDVIRADIFMNREGKSKGCG